MNIAEGYPAVGLSTADEALQPVQHTAREEPRAGVALRLSTAFRERAKEREVFAQAVIFRIHAVPPSGADLAATDVGSVRG